MSAQLKPSDNIKPVDPVWDAIRANAKGVVADEPALRGSIQHVASGHKTYFTSLDLPVALLRSAIDHLAGRHQALD